MREFNILPISFQTLNTIILNLLLLSANSANIYTTGPHNIKSLPNATEQFLQWFVGFVDGEGSFSIVPNKTWSFVRFAFNIELHVDDIEILHKIAKILGVGIVKRVGKNSARFSVFAINDIVTVILPIFLNFPLQTTKALDFACFSEAIQIKLNSISKKLSETDLTKIKDLKAGMNSGRVTIDKEELDILTKRVSINAFWLIGFIEGEGTFGYKHLVPYFQIGQHKKSLFVLNAIESFILKLPKVQCETINNKKPNVHYALNQKTNVYSISIVDIDSLFYYIVPFFLSMPFLTRKAVDFKYWVISVRMHKFGYSYLPEGKKLLYRYLWLRINFVTLLI